MNTQAWATPLHLAGIWGHASTVRFLLATNADSIALASQGRTADPLARRTEANALNLTAPARKSARKGGGSAEEGGKERAATTAELVAGEGEDRDFVLIARDPALLASSNKHNSSWYPGKFVGKLSWATCLSEPEYSAVL